MKKKIEFWNTIVLAIVLGNFGIQEFYLGRTFRGILGVLFWWTGIPSIIAIIQIGMWLFKGKEDFEKEFNK